MSELLYIFREFPHILWIFSLRNSICRLRETYMLMMLYHWIHQLLNILVVGDDAYPEIEVQAHHVHEDVAHFCTSFLPSLNS